VESSQTLVHAWRASDQEGWVDPPGADALVLGRYRLLERLGAGGFGVVWRAYDELLRRAVAVKRVPLAREEDGERVSREALATARLAHPAIVALYEACAAQDAFYLISELVQGDTLAQLLAARALSDERVLEIGIALAGALSHAHSRGVIHRDVKPQNVLIPSQHGVPAATGEALGSVAKLTDFGGARLTGEDVLTRTGDVLGTLAYMAPEQTEGADVGEAVDLYSLALVLYEALCGVNPVRGSTPAATVRRIGRPIPPLAHRRGDLPPSLTRALDTALAPSSVDRGTLDRLRLALEGALAPESRLPERGPPRRQSAHRGQQHMTELYEIPPWQTGPARPPAAPRVAAAPDRVRHRRPHPREDRMVEAQPQPPHGPASKDRPTLPRALWTACAAAAIVWQVWVGRPGVALLAFAALLPLLALARTTRQGSPACVLAPVLGLAGLAGAFPAIAGQAMRWRSRAALAALGYWWLTLAEPLLSRHLWLGEATGTPARAAWEGSLPSAAVHVVGPMLSLGVLLGATLWGVAAMLLPFLVRGRSAALDVVAATTWSAALATAAPVLDSGVLLGGAHASPRGTILGGVFGGVLAVAARALRGPV
jgi:eukaryotic-like serine/threonine-protein kinase